MKLDLSPGWNYLPASVNEQTPYTILLTSIYRTNFHTVADQFFASAPTLNFIQFSLVPFCPDNPQFNLHFQRKQQGDAVSVALLNENEGAAYVEKEGMSESETVHLS